jgi:hypothetical protein
VGPVPDSSLSAHPRLKLESPLTAELHGEALRLVRHSALGDNPARVRGVPLIAHGVQGAMLGTQPESAVLRSQLRRL